MAGKPDLELRDPDVVADKNNPELTTEDFARARPFKDVFPEHYAAWEKAGFSLAPEVADGIRALGPDYTARAEQHLREAPAKGEL